MKIYASLIHTLATEDAFEGRTVVVTDVLRATTTIAHALYAGAAKVIPCLEVNDARNLAANDPNILTGGERGGTQIDGFTFSNSPADYTPDAVGGNTIAFTTTNGTRAMRQCAKAHRVLLGAFVNLTAVCNEASQETDIHLLCAGTRGAITREDVLFAGAAASFLVNNRNAEIANDDAAVAVDAWRAVEGSPLAETLRHTQGGRNLIRLNYAADIETAAQVDSLTVVPELNVRQWEITPAI